MENKEFSFEEAMKELESIVAALERGDVSLEDSLKLYEKGVGLVREANKLLTDAKERIIAVSGVQTND
jgi:exodeoxyribonuclease VII small subunit